MTTLEEIAFHNLQFLNDRDDFLANRYKIDKNQLVKEDDDTVYTLDDLEYPIFFTFHQLMNHVHSSYEPRFHGKTKKELLDMFEIALNTLNEYYIETDNSDKRFERVIDDIDDKITFIIQYYKYGFCHRFQKNCVSIILGRNLQLIFAIVGGAGGSGAPSLQP